MDYFAGLDVSMSETHVCVVDRMTGLPALDADHRYTAHDQTVMQHRSHSPRSKFER
jgi:hypothetical protein